MPPGLEIPALELARRLDGGERMQILDVRAPDAVAEGRIAFGPGLEFRALPASEVYALSSLDPLHLDPARPVTVVCSHGNSSRGAAGVLREHGLAASSLAGGMAAWEAVYLPRRLSPTEAIEHAIQLDRVGKGALSYVLASDGDALVVDPGRHLDRYEAVLNEIGATPAAVLDTHMHADYLSGAGAAARRWKVPYFLHPEDARSPFDGRDGRLAYQPVGAGDTIAFGHATVTVEHVPGHTLGSVAVIAGGALALTGDFLFIQSVGRPDLGAQSAAWARLLWESLEDVRGRWPGEQLVLPAHYASDLERRADRTVAARYDVIAATNPVMALTDEAAFLRWITEHETPAPDRYRTIKLANLGLIEIADGDAEVLESGANQCAVSS
jgi:glyoxylase-like metal-dependent hydrolase (beta-lactamase superfamily II)/rhodanese-related sulfurtransferase